MHTITNVKVDSDRHIQVATASRANYDQNLGTITLLDAVNIIVPLVQNSQYFIDSKDLANNSPVKTSYQGLGAPPNNNHIFLVS